MPNMNLINIFKENNIRFFKNLKMVCGINLGVVKLILMQKIF